MYLHRLTALQDAVGTDTAGNKRNTPEGEVSEPRMTEQPRKKPSLASGAVPAQAQAAGPPSVLADPSTCHPQVCPVHALAGCDLVCSSSNWGSHWF